MKIKTKVISTDELLEIKKPKRIKIKKSNIFWRTLIRLISIPDLLATHFTFTSEGIEKAGKGPFLILMNHSSFLDLEIAFKILYPKPFSIVCTSDGFVGKKWLLRELGCIPTQKFVTDVSLVKDIIKSVKEYKTSVLMYPEASYSFDGTATDLPKSIGKLIKKLNIPVMTIIADGSFLRQPLYNGLKKRKVKVTAHYKCLLTSEQIENLTADEIDGLLKKEFSFDYFKSQKEKGIHIRENDRADFLERILFKCPDCLSEDTLIGKGTHIKCEKCQKSYFMDTLGSLCATEGETQFSHIPHWYDWQRQQIRNEILKGDYKREIDVTIAVLRDYKAIYFVGDGKLTHTDEGFRLLSDDKKIDFKLGAKASYSLYADYYWYEIADTVCIGDKEYLYYCFPKEKTSVARYRIATEEIYKIKTEKEKV